MTKCDTLKINELFTQINDTRDQIEQLYNCKNKCSSDLEYWGLQSQIDEQNKLINKYNGELLSLIKSLCYEAFNIDIADAKRIRNRAKQAIIDLDRYRPTNYKRMITIINDIVDSSGKKS